MNRFPDCRRVLSIIILASSGAFMAGCLAPRPEAITQVATIDSLLAGVYDGHMALRELRGYGDFGIGTFSRLDGEMILLNGTFYKAQADGKVTRPPKSEKTPFASVTRFTPNIQVALPPMTNDRDLQKLIDRNVPEQNRFCAFRVRGTFKSIRVRSVPAQSKPYPALAVVTKSQPVFDLSDVRGTLIGFRSPPFVKGVNVPGYHLHFLSDDHSKGGHVLNALVSHGTLEVDSQIAWLNVFLPQKSDAFARANLTKDRSRELQSAEQSTGRSR